MDSWLTIMLMCGLLIASLQGTDGFRLRRSKQDKNEMLETNINQLIKHYNTGGGEWVEKAVFARHLGRLNDLKSSSCTCESLMLKKILNVYEDIFTDMLNKLEKKELKASVKDIMTEVKQLRDKYSEEQKLLGDLHDLHHVKVKNSTVQQASLNEFLMTYYRAYGEKPHDRGH
ncbi:interferon gamma-related-like [Misgurnus anguillicaudatus]|uniref:interferon gamma-related-like n=1 Tax=Misgurnus anguillicaudatus TaxID=75329 RepID=UPI003CCF53F9